jgi:hypothetical protein
MQTMNTTYRFWNQTCREHGASINVKAAIKDQETYLDPSRCHPQAIGKVNT